MQQRYSTGVQCARNWLKTAETAIANHSDRLNAINVFPVPDGDTGTNLYATLKVASDTAARNSAEDWGSVLAEAANAALDDARGNSGTLFAVFLSGFAEPLQDRGRLTAELLSEALDRGQLRSWSALTDPVAGTMLSAMSSASRAVRDARAATVDESNASLASAVAAAMSGAREAVLRSESELGALTQARVVDAGAVGFLLLLSSLYAAISNQPLEDASLDTLHGYRIDDPHIHVGLTGDPGVELMCSMVLTPFNAAALRAQLDELGESVIMSPVRIGDDELHRWRIHVHVPDGDLALETIRHYGRPENLTLTDLSGEAHTLQD